MTDVHSSATRSYNMSRIRSKNTKPELLIRKELFAHGFRFRIHVKDLPGHPDIVLKKYRTILFVHGCFWHGHEHCKYFVIPRTRTDWWLAKINRNKDLDKAHTQELLEQGWQVLEIFECQLKGEKLQQTVDQLILRIRSAG